MSKWVTAEMGVAGQFAVSERRESAADGRRLPLQQIKLPGWTKYRFFKSVQF
jgi:hypothetical protein